MTQQNAAMVEQSTAATRSLSSEAQRLGELVAQFRVSAGGQAMGYAPAAARPAAIKAPARVPAPAPRPAPAPAPAPAPQTPYATEGNLARKPAPAPLPAPSTLPDEDDWSEF
jgi:methyl-accepting chemotaxis protein